MTRLVPRVGWYRFRATFRRTWGGYLAVVVLVGMLGGLSMGSVAGARRTQSSFARFLASTNPSDFTLPTGIFSPAFGTSSGYDPALLAAIAGLPGVKRVESIVGLNILPLGEDGAPLATITPIAGLGAGSVDGLGFDQDRLTVAHGRLPDRERADEFVLTEATATRLGLRVGDVAHFGVYTNAQTLLDGFGTASVAPDRQIDATLVGIGAVLNSQVVQDDVDNTPSGSADWFFAPSLTRQLVGCCAYYMQSGLQLDAGGRDQPAVEAELRAVLQPGNPLIATSTAVGAAKAERAIKPEALALGAFGAIAALAALVIAGQAIGRQLRLGAAELEILRAIGAGPAATSTDGLIGVVGAVAIGSLLAAVVAIGVSPLAPIGPARAFDPSRGIDADWAVLGLGVALLIVVLSGLAAALAFREAPHRIARRRRAAPESRLARAAAAVGLPAPAVAGIRFALERTGARNSVPARSAIGGAVLALTVMIATVTFGASLHTLVSQPALYGWNWTYELTAGGGDGDIPDQQAATLLDHEPDVAAWAGAYFGYLHVDGQPVPVLGMSPNAPVAPSVLSGHGVDAPDQIVLGATTLASLHKHVGDTVDVNDGATQSTRLRIVGTATLPATGVTSQPHLEMGTGAVLAYQLIPAANRNPFDNPIPGPNTMLVRVKDGTNVAAARAALQQIADATSNTANFGVTVQGVQRPAEIVNYRTMGTTPALLGAAVALGAALALGLTLLSSVRRRGRDLAVLKTLGFTRRQLLAVVACQASVAAVIGALLGIPLGVALGRQLWLLFAKQIHVVPQPSVPALTVVLLAIGALALAVLVAVIPGRIAARTTTAILLRAD